MARIHHVLLLWHHILGLCLPPLLFVSRYRFTPLDQSLTCSTRMTFPQTACAIVACSKNPRSRTVKRTTFGSCSSPLLCSWYAPSLTFPLISPLPPTTRHADDLQRARSHGPTGSIPSLQPPLPLLTPRLRAHLFLVPTTPFHAHIALWPRHHHCAIPPLCPRRLLMAAHRHLARRRERPRRVRRWPRRLVHP
jgi:hypothetical protein